MRKLLTILLTMIALGAASQTTQLLGGPSIRVVNRGDMQVDSILYIPRTIVTSRAPFQSGALRYQASDSALYHWTGTAWRRVSPLIDTGAISTRAWRQKGIDSIVTLISTLGGGTVLSVSAGTGMNFTTITTSGSVSADTNVLATRANRDKLKDSLQANIAGKVNISDTATMLSAYLRRADTTSMLSPYLRKTDTTAMLAPYVRNAGFGLTKGTQALSVDSALMATRARVQKGIDSVASLVTTIDSLTFSTRAWRQKGVDSVAALANTKATATGTTNYLSKFTGTSSLGNSIVYATTSEVGISTPSPTESLDVNGRVRVRTIDSTATGMNMLYADASGVIKKAAIPAGGSGTVTSVSAGTGMSFTTITTTGSVSADTVALATRAWRQKGIDSLANVRVGGTGTTNYVPKFTASGTIGNSQIFDNGTSVGVSTASPVSKFEVQLGYITSGNQSSTSGSKILGGAWSGSQHLTTFGSDRSSGGPVIGYATWPSPTTSQNFVSAAGIDIARSAYFVGGSEHRWYFGASQNRAVDSSLTMTERMRLTSAGRLLVGTTTEGTNTVDIAGTLRSTQGANFATSTGNVGIGTSSPTERLQVDGTIRVNNGDVTMNNGRGVFWGGGTEYITGSQSTNSLSMLTNNATRLFINSSGNVGIGTTTPDTRLSVTGDGTGIIRMGSGVGGNSATIGLTGAISSTNYTLSGDAGNSNLAINRPTGGAMSFRSNGSAQMTLTSAGRLLVGTETEGTNTVDINGTLRTVNGANFATSSGDVVIGGTNSSSSKLRVIGNGANFGDGTNTFSLYMNIERAWEFKPSGSGASTLLQLSDVTGSKTFQIIDGVSSNVAANFRNGDVALSPGTGNVNIGQSLGSATEKLDVNGRIRARTIDSTSSPINMLTSDVNGVIRKAAVPSASLSGGISGYMTRWSGSSTVDTSQIFQQANRIGIGTTTPVGRLSVAGDGTGFAHIGAVGLGGNTAGITFMSTIGAGNYGIVGSPNGDLVLNSATGQPIEFRRNNANQMTLNSDGTLLIGTTSADANVRLRVNGRARVETIDSSAGPINMLWADVNGNIRKAAVPSGGGGSGTVTSVATGFGIDGGTITTTGTLTADTFEVASRLRLYKVADSLAALSRITGSGTANYVPLFTSSTAVGNSSIFEQSSEVRIGTTSDAGAFRLQVNGVTYSSGGIRTDAPSGGTAQTWKFGSAIADSVALDANNYLEVEVNGVFYRIALITLL